MTAVPIDLQARVRLAHAAVQALAEQHGIDLLHVKGPALDATLSRPDRPSFDFSLGGLGGFGGLVCGAAGAGWDDDPAHGPCGANGGR